MKTRHRHKRTRNKSKKKGGGFFGSIRNKLFGKKSPISKMPNQRMSENISYSPESLKHAFNFAVSPNQGPKNLGHGSFGRVKKTLTNGVVKRTPFTKTLQQKNGVSQITLPKEFKREMELMKRASSNENPYVVRRLNSYYNNNAGYVQLETLDSGSELYEAITKKVPKTVNQRNVKEIIVELLKGLDSIHARDILHLDIKPENIWVFPDTKKIKYFDFGMSEIMDNGQVIAGKKGSPHFLKPEKKYANKYARFIYDKTDDYYALSITLSDLLQSIINDIDPNKYTTTFLEDLSVDNIFTLVNQIKEDVSLTNDVKNTLDFIVTVMKNLQRLNVNNKAINALPPNTITSTP